MSETEIDREKYIVCCPFCDNSPCCRGTDKCDAEIWVKGKEKAESEK
jgi:hypothetical protein